jgi:hypothetical protein
MASLLALAVLSGGVAVAATRLRAHPDLPPTTPEQLIAAAVRAAEHGPDVSGTVNATIDLGLPSFPEQGPAPTGLAGLLAELSGTHRVRLWSSSDGYRLNELLPTEERAIYVSRAGGWLWSSPEYTAVHLYNAGDLARLKDAAARESDTASQAERSRMLHLFDPLALTRQMLRAVTRSTDVGMGSPERVAGRPAYVLVLTPKDASTLVGRVTIDVDAVTHVPLAVRVYAKGATTPSLSAVFSRVSYDPISPSVYNFTPPPGAKVIDAYREGTSGSPSMHGSNPGVQGARVLGSGWSSILAVRVDAGTLARAGSTDGVNLRQLLPFTGPLFSVRLAMVGGQTWLLTGAVPQSALAAAEPDLH